MVHIPRGVRRRRWLGVAVVAALLLGAMTVTAGPVAAAAYSGFDWEDGTVQGWSSDWDGADPQVSSDQAYSGSSSLAIRLEGEEYPGFRSPSALSGLGVGSVVSYYVYVPDGAPLKAWPYAVDGSYTERFAAAKTTLTPGTWTQVTLIVPSVDILRYIGIEIDDPGWTGTVYLDAVNWTPPTDLPPVVTTKPASSVGSTTAVLNGTVDRSGLTTTCRFEYGQTRAYGRTAAVDADADGPVAARITGLTLSATYHFRLSCQSSGGLRNGADLIFRTVGDPRGELFRARNLIYGSHIGAWDMDGGTAVKDPTAMANVMAAQIRVIKWQMWKPPCELRADDCETTADFNAAIDGIRALGAEPLIGLPPIWDRQCTGSADAWSTEWQQWVIRTAGSRVRLYEMGNEPDNYCGMSGQQYNDQLWVQVPALKAYARSLGLCIFVGGPAWATSDDASLAQLHDWLAAAKASYLAHDRDRDWLPDFVSTHTYLKTPSENDNQADAQARIDYWRDFYTNLRGDIDTTFAGLTDDGYPIAEELKLADTEWNDTIDNNWPGNDSQDWTDFYYGAMFTMLREAGVWMSNQSTIASHTGGALDLLQTDGTPKPAYYSYKSISTTDPHN